MFAVDLLHKLIRHSQAHNRRETIAFGRRSNAVLERAALLVVWRDVLSKRRFPGRTRMPEGWSKINRRGWITPAVGRNRPHALRLAF